MRTVRSAFVVTVVGGLIIGGAGVAHADPTDVATATAEVAKLEGQSVAASQRATAARANLASSLERQALFAAHIAEMRADLAGQQRTLELLARQLYVNGGVSNQVMHFSLDDPEDFLRSLDQLAAVGEAQNTSVVTARAKTVSMQETQKAHDRENERIASEVEQLAATQAEAGAMLAAARTRLQMLQEEERRQVAEAVAAQREAQRIAVEAASSVQAFAGDPTAATEIGAPSTVDDPAFAQSSAWAATAKPQSVIKCESGGNYSINTGNGYYGAWQFDYPSWHANGGGRFAQFPHQASKPEQDFVAWTYWSRSGWGPWACA